MQQGAPDEPGLYLQKRQARVPGMLAGEVEKMAYTEDEWFSTMMALALLGDVYEDDPVDDEDTGQPNEMEHNQHNYGRYQS